MREFRKGISRLRKAGITAANPKTAVRTKANVKLWKQFKDVATGKAMAINLAKNSDTLAKYKNPKLKPQGMKVKGSFVIVPNDAGYKRLQIVKGEPLLEGMVAKVKPLANGEIERVIFPMDFANIETFAREAQKSPEWNALKNKKERFAFYINDNVSLKPYSSLQDLIRSVMEYKSVRAMVSKRNSRSLKSFWRAFEVVRIREDETTRVERTRGKGETLRQHQTREKARARRRSRDKARRSK